MKLFVALISLASTSAFSMHGHNAVLMNSRPTTLKRNVLKMSAVDDEVAALRAAAQKARDVAKKLAKVSNRPT